MGKGVVFRREGKPRATRVVVGRSTVLASSTSSNIEIRQLPEGASDSANFTLSATLHLGTSGTTFCAKTFPSPCVLMTECPKPQAPPY